MCLQPGCPHTHFLVSAWRFQSRCPAPDVRCRSDAHCPSSAQALSGLHIEVFTHSFIHATKMHSYVKGTADQNCPPWPDRIVITCMSYLTTGGPGKECGTNKLLASGGIQERSKGSHRPPRILVGIHLVCAHHQEGP